MLLVTHDNAMETLRSWFSRLIIMSEGNAIHFGQKFWYTVIGMTIIQDGTHIQGRVMNYYCTDACHLHAFIEGNYANLEETLK